MAHDMSISFWGIRAIVLGTSMWELYSWDYPRNDQLNKPDRNGNREGQASPEPFRVHVPKIGVPATKP